MPHPHESHEIFKGHLRIQATQLGLVRFPQLGSNGLCPRHRRALPLKLLVKHAVSNMRAFRWIQSVFIAAGEAERIAICYALRIGYRSPCCAAPGSCAALWPWRHPGFRDARLPKPSNTLRCWLVPCEGGGRPQFQMPDVVK